MVQNCKDHVARPQEQIIQSDFSPNAYSIRFKSLCREETPLSVSASEWNGTGGAPDEVRVGEGPVEWNEEEERGVDSQLIDLKLFTQWVKVGSVDDLLGLFQGVLRVLTRRPSANL